ncbi:MAG: hypothetical protein WD042_12395 [Phycisphaeraceae bacterium]
MSLRVTREDVWAASIPDAPGALAEKLSVLAEAGATVDFVITRRSPFAEDRSVVFITPVRGNGQERLAREIGFDRTRNLHAVRVDAAAEPGLTARIARELAAATVNLRGFSAAVIADRTVVHLAFDAEADASKAVEVLERLG